MIAFSLFSKILVVTAILFTAMDMMVNADNELPPCPDQLAILYKECGGKFDQCSTCVRLFENRCKEEVKKMGVYDFYCDSCISLVKLKCEGRKTMCFDSKDCQAGGECRDYDCVYRSRSVDIFS